MPSPSWCSRSGPSSSGGTTCRTTPSSRSTSSRTPPTWRRSGVTVSGIFAVVVVVRFVGWFICLTPQQLASVSQGRICSDKFTCCHTEIEVADPTFYLTHSQYTDTGPTSPSADPLMPDAWQGSHWNDSTRKK